MLSCEQRIFVDGGKGGSIRIHSAIPTLPLLDPDAARSRAVRRSASMPMVLRSGVIFTPDSPGGARRLSHSGFSHVLLSRAYLADRDGDASTYCQHSHQNHGHCSRYVWNGREQANTEITCFRNIVDQIRQPQTQAIGASSRAEINNNEKPYFPV